MLIILGNKMICTLGHPQDMFSNTAIKLQPIFAQWIQNTYALAHANKTQEWGLA